MKNKILKFLGAIVLTLIIAISVFYFANNENIPEGKQGNEADLLANKMLKAINHEAFKNTELIEWSFRNQHFYKWYQQEDKVEVSWGKNKVVLYTKSTEKSTVSVDGIIVKDPSLLKTAINRGMLSIVF